MDDDVSFPNLVFHLQRLHGDSIESIGYRNCLVWGNESEEARDQLKRMEKDLREKLPKLKEINLWIYDYPREEFDSLIDSFAAKGVKVDIDCECN